MLSEILLILPGISDVQWLFSPLPNNESLCQTVQSVQYKAALAITGAINGRSQTKLYKELGLQLELETIKFRQWYRRLCIYALQKVKTSSLPLYLLKYILDGSNSYNTQLNEGGLKHTIAQQMFSNIHSFQYAILERNKLDLHEKLVVVYCL